VSLSAVQARPLGALGRNISLGYGLTGALTLPLDRAGRLSVRAEVGEVVYGNESQRTAFSETVGDRVDVRARTTNAVVPIMLGLQADLPVGPVSLYVNGGIGAKAFYTESRVEPTNRRDALASTVNQSDFTLGWSVGSGLSVPVHSRARLVSVDVGVQYHGGGTARYLAPGSFVDLPDGGTRFNAMESGTNLLTVRVGVRVGL
jgi:opacity protein-like surface antigen